MIRYFNPRTKAWESKEEMERRSMDQAAETLFGIKADRPHYTYGIDVGRPGGDETVLCRRDVSGAVEFLLLKHGLIEPIDDQGEAQVVEDPLLLPPPAP